MKITRNIELDGLMYGDTFNRVFVVAEIGANHMGDINLCKAIIWAAKQAGCTAVKIQKRNNEDLYTAEYLNKEYESENAFGATYGEHRNRLEFNFLQIAALQEYCRSIDITFFSTVWDFNSLYLVNKLDLPIIKIASGDLRSYPLIMECADSGKPLIISTGGAEWEDIDSIYYMLKGMDAEFCFLHCTAMYPTPADACNLAAIERMRERYPDVVIGYSSHYSGVIDAVYAVERGAAVIEKHFTINRALKGADQAFSLEPSGMESMIHYIDNRVVMRGDGDKYRRDEEIPALIKMEKSLYAARDISVGETITREMIVFKSPGGGLPLAFLSSVIGKKAEVGIKKESFISLDDLV